MARPTGTSTLRQRLAEGLRRARIRWTPRRFLRSAVPSSAELGAAGEELAARFLLREGWRLRGRRVRTPEGEVDLWAERDGVAWVIEVKTGRLDRIPRVRGAPSLPRWDLRWRPGRSIGTAQLRRLFRAARHLAPASGARCEVALVEVLVATRGGRIEVLPPVRLLEGVPLTFASPRE